MVTNDDKTEDPIGLLIQAAVAIQEEYEDPANINIGWGFALSPEARKNLSEALKPFDHE